MSTHKNINLICVVILIVTVAITILFMNGKSLGLVSIVDEDAESYTGNEYFTANDQNGSWDTSSAVKITLKGDSAKVSGNGAYAYGGDVYIQGGGYYYVTGTLDDGSIIINGYDSSKVWIMLDGADINCSDSAPIIVNNADKVFITLAEGSVNTLSDGETYSSEAETEEINAAIFSHDDLTINGSGTLVINGNYNHGIRAKDKLVITGGDITINSVADAINVNDEFNLMEASLTINAGDDGIHSDTSVYIASGTVMINECYEGIEAPHIDILDGEITIYPTDDGINANGGSDQFGAGGFGPGMQQDGTGEMPDMSREASTDAEATKDEEASEEEDDSYVRISGGTVTIINENANDSDGIDSNKDIYISGGTIRITITGSGPSEAIDYGSDRNGVLEITGGDVSATVNGVEMTAEDLMSADTMMGGFGGGGHGGMRPSDGTGEDSGEFTPPEDGERPEGMEPPEDMGERPEGMGERPEGMKPGGKRNDSGNNSSDSNNSGSKKKATSDNGSDKK